MNSRHGSTVTITRGTGSFGSTMAVDLLRKGVGTVNIFSRDEAKQDAMRRRNDDPRVRYFIADVRDADSVERAVSGADFVLHAAALKQAPSCEFLPEQAVKTDVRCTYNVIGAAAKAGIRSVVRLSTDKAVYPVNAKGMTKALTEKTAQAFARNNPSSTTTVSMTRYGNVIYSRGSVIPLFIEHLQSAKPLTLTEPLMTRFPKSLQQSIDLLYHEFFHALPGDLFVRKAPASTVETLGRAVASLWGDDDPEIRVIGSRRGEKLHETMLSREEMVKAEDHGGYYRVPLDARTLQYELYFDEGETRTATVQDHTSKNTQRLSVDETKDLLLTIPEVAAQLERNRDLMEPVMSGAPWFDERNTQARGPEHDSPPRVLIDEGMTFSVNGTSPAIIDMPTLWAHKITHTGDGELITTLWTNDPQHADSYSEDFR